MNVIIIIINGSEIKQSQTPFSKEVTWNIPADFQPIPLEDARKRTIKMFILHMQFYLIEKKTNNLLRDWYD